MRVLIFAACAALLAAPALAAKPKKPSSYGAIAYHRETQSWGAAYDAKSARDAKLSALERCGNRRCEVVLNLRNGCGALADGPTRFAATPGATRDEAETKALRKCDDKACKVVAWACTR